jgi:hypothetical protein
MVNVLLAGWFSWPDIRLPTSHAGPTCFWQPPGRSEGSLGLNCAGTSQTALGRLDAPEARSIPLPDRRLQLDHRKRVFHFGCRTFLAGAEPSVAGSCAP